MKTQDVKFDANRRLAFNEREVTVTNAKRLASRIYNMYGTNTRFKPVDEFAYTTENGTYIFYRRNIIYPSGQVVLGQWR